MTQLGFNTTRLVHDLCAVLESLEIPFQTGVSEAMGLLRIDLALPDKQVCSLLAVLSWRALLLQIMSICLFDAHHISTYASGPQKPPM